MNVIQQLEKEQQKAKVPALRAGDTVKVSRTPEPWRRMTTPWKTWMRERVPSTTFT